MNEIQIFNKDGFGNIRTIEEDGKILFVATDIAKALGYSNDRDAIARHCRWVVKRDIPHPQSKTKTIEVNVIPEGDIYRLVANSELPNAEKFESWVFDEVIPTIRKTGSYQKPLTQQEMMRIQLGMIDDHENRILNLENTMTIDYGQQRVIEDTVNKTVIDSLGGKESLAYRQVGKKVFAECNRDLKHYFNVNARNNIPKLKFDEAVEYAKNWKPCTNTMMLINNCNAQMAF